MSVLPQDVVSNMMTNTRDARSESRIGTQHIGITSFTDVTPSYWPTLETISRLARLPAGWDTYGSPPLQQPAVQGALHLVILLNLLRLPPPQLSPVPGGGIQFEWDLLSRSLELEIHPDGQVSWLRTTEADEDADGTLPTYRDNAVQAHMHWLLNGELGRD